jgi:hypothetical protein
MHHAARMWREIDTCRNASALPGQPDYPANSFAEPSQIRRYIGLPGEPNVSTTMSTLNSRRKTLEIRAKNLPEDRA